MKKYDLERSMFISASVFVSIIFLPMLAMCVAALCIAFGWWALLVAFGFLAAYVILLTYFWRESHKRTCYLQLHDDRIEIVYRDAHNAQIKSMCLQHAQIKRIEYYRLHSLLSWLQLAANYTLPMCVFVTYVSDADGEEYSANVGYLRYREVKEIAEYTGIGVKFR